MDSLHAVDPSTGQLTTVGGLGFDADSIGLASNPLGGLFLVALDTLYQVDTSSGQATAIGDLNASLIQGLAYHSDMGVLYGTSSDDNFYQIDTTTGSATMIGMLGVDIGGSGLAYDSSASRLQLVDNFSDKLYEVNPATGAATEIGDLNLSDVVGLAFNPETDALFGADWISDELVAINRSTGAGNVIGAFGFDVGPSGLAFQTTTIPEPNVFAMLTTAGLAVTLRRRRNASTMLCG